MSTFLIALGCFVGYFVAYFTYGRWLARRIFRLDPEASVPSRQLEDGVDYVPSKKSLVFGHHFTSIAGTGPIVGPAIAVFWGWLPALIWVLFGSIFIGAVHDFGSLVVSMRNRGQTIGEVSGQLISPRTQLLFLLLLAFALTIVLAIFGLVIAQIFSLYPQSVLAVWISLPLAIVLGVMLRKNANGLMPLSVISLLCILAAIYVGTYYLPIVLPVQYPVVVWTVILLVYCAVASVLPVWILLQPRDYVNCYLLFFSMALIVAGLGVASWTGKADLLAAAPAVARELPLNTPPIFPFLFITIACGAVSGFHCLVSSGTSSKQIACESDAQVIGYGSMLLEGALAVVVILACCAGIGMGKFRMEKSGAQQSWGASIIVQPVKTEDGRLLIGREAWRDTYSVGEESSWENFRLGNMVGAFVDGSANFLSQIGLPIPLGVGLVAVLVACFAATTLDSATRLQRYVIQELAATARIRPLQPLTNRYAATALAVLLGGTIAMIPAKAGGEPGTGGLLLWPLFGATNQLLAGLAFLVIVFYLRRRGLPIWFLIPPTVLLIFLPAWALSWQLFNFESGWIGGFETGEDGAMEWVWRWHEKKLLGTVGLMTLLLQLWMVFDAVRVWPGSRAVDQV
jgi:carbon starvation protein